MKTKITLLTLFFAFIMNAQVTYIPMPAGYGYYDFQNYWKDGSSHIAYSEGSFLYGITSKLVSGTTGQYEAFIFRYDTSSNATTIYSQPVGSQAHPSLFPENFTNYNGKIYFNLGNNLYRLNLSNGIINELIIGSSNYYIKNDKVYSFGGATLYNNSYANQLKIYNLLTNTVYSPQYTNPITNVDYNIYPQLYNVNGNSTYFTGFYIATNGGDWNHKLFKIDTNDVITILHEYNEPGFYGSLFSSYNNIATIPLLNNKLILNRQNGNTGIETYDISNNTYNSSLYNLGYNSPSCFISNGWLYFNIAQAGGGYIIHKTNGNTALQAGLPNFYQYGTVGEPVTLYNGNYYGDFNNNIYKSDLTFDNTFSISSSLGFKYSLVVNNKLMFISNNNDLVNYDGTSFSTLPLGLNYVFSRIYKMIQIGNFLYVNASKINGSSTYEDGIYKIDLSTLSTNQNSLQPNISFSPNPTTSSITFTQEINSLEIFDLTGKKVKTFENANSVFDVADLEKGIYLLKGKTIEGSEFNEKLIKE